MSERKLYTLKEAAEELNLTEHTIRYYSNMGLFHCPRDSSNRRVLDDNAIGWLKGIKYLRDGGMPISDVKLYCELCRKGEATVAQRFEMLVAQKEIAGQLLRDTALAVRFLDQNIEKCREKMGCPGSVRNE